MKNQHIRLAIVTLAFVTGASVGSFAQPGLTSPSNITGTSFQVNWNTVGGADGYILDVSTNNLFSSYVLQGQSISGGSTSSYNVSGLNFLTTYYYRMKSFTFCCGASGYSGTGQATTLSGAPVAPNLNVGSNITNVSFTASWNSVATATNYFIDVSTSSVFSGFTGIYNNLSLGNVTSVSVNNLLDNTTYYFRVRASNTNGTSGNSNVRNLLTKVGAPTAISQTNYNGSGFDANWQPVTGATVYNIDVSTASNFSSFLSGYNDAGTASTTLHVTGISSSVTYYYRVRATNSAGPSVSSNVITVAPIPGVPTVLAASAITATSFTANWNAVANAAYYQLDVSTVGDFTSGVTTYSPGGTSMNVTGLASNTAYYYRVRGANTSGASANSGNAATTTLPPAPTATSASNVTQSSFQANWTGGTPSVKLDVSTVSNFATFLSGYNDALIVGASANITGLTPGTTYYYRIRNSNGSGVSGNSNVISFAPVIASPVATAATNLTNVSMSANWNANSLATGYFIDVSTSSSFSSFLSGYNNLSVGNVTTVAINNLLDNTTHYYRVRASNGASTSGHSNVISTTTKVGAPIAIAQTNYTGSSFNTNWQPVAGTLVYNVDVSTVSNFASFLSGYNDAGTTNTTLPVTGISSSVTYYYRVRATNVSGASVNSNVITVAPIPGVPTVLAASAVTTTSFTANWNAVANAAFYQLDVSTDGGFSSGVTTYSPGGTSLNITGLNANTAYYYRVRGANTSGASANSGNAATITMPTAPTATAASNITSTSFQANWTSVTPSVKLDVSPDNFASFLLGYNDALIVGTSANITGLNAGTLYYYKVRSTNASGASPSSGTITALTVSAPPTLNAATTISATGFTANWNSVLTATSYLLDVSIDQNFGSFVYQNLSGAGTSRAVTGLTVNTNTYYYRVRSVNASGTSTPSSTGTIIAFPTAPLATASTNLTGSSFTANWNSVATAIEYRVDVSTSETFSSFVAGYSNIQSLTLSLNVTGLTAHTKHYYRVRAINSSGPSPNSNRITAGNFDQNYVRSIAVTVAGKTSFAQVESATLNERSTSFEFVDGLGRPMQTVMVQGSPGQKDVISAVAYDEYGRSTKSYLPYTETTTAWWRDDALKTPNATGTDLDKYRSGKQYAFYQVGGALPSDQFPYAETIFEPSPLNRTIKQGAPGSSWQPAAGDIYSFADNTVKKRYGMNAAAEVILWRFTPPTVFVPLGTMAIGSPAYYSPNELYKDLSYDEHNNQVVQFTDRDGKILLRKVKFDATTWAETYYIYDDFKNLATVIQPEGMAQLSPKLPVTWANLAGVQVQSDNTLKKTAASGYGNAAATSTVATETLIAGSSGWVEATAIETNTSRMIGLSTAQGNNGVTINFAIEFRNNGTAWVWENGVAVAQVATYLAGTVVRVSREGSNVRYYVDGVLKRTSGLTSTSTLLVDCAFDHIDGTLKNVTTSFNFSLNLPNVLSNQAFRYTYDGRNRMTQKLVPGMTSAVYAVYDDRDRVVLTQDANQRPGLTNSTKYWTFIKYDVQNRPIMTGIKDTATAAVLSQAQMQAAVDAFYAKASSRWGETYVANAAGNIHGYTNRSYPVRTVGSTTDKESFLTVTYYDDYDFKNLFGSTQFDFRSGEIPPDGQLPGQETIYSLRTYGMVTGTRTRMISNATWLKGVNYYDEKARPIQTVTENSRGLEVSTSVLDFVGKTLRTKTSTYGSMAVSWTGIVSATVSGDKLTSTGGTNWAAGAVSTQVLPAGVDGWAECTVVSTSPAVAFGLSDVNTNTDPATTDYNWNISSGGGRPYENGVAVGSNVSVTPGDVLRIERVNGKVHFKRNGVIRYTSTTASSTSLMVDVSLFNTGAKFTNGRVSHTFLSYSASPQIVSKRFTYDHVSRLNAVHHKMGVAGTEVQLSQLNYNEIGQLTEKNLHSTNGTSFRQQVDLRYNIRGWLSRINDADLTTEGSEPRDLFGMNLFYNESSGTSNTAQFNGNISAMRWSNNLGLSDTQSAYNFSYDPIGRLTDAISKLKTGGSWGAGKFDEYGITYDQNGNIKTLKRTWLGDQSDDLVYDYGTTPSNKLLSVTDIVSDPADKLKGFRDGNTAGSDYTYDVNGNLLRDLNKGIGGNITYNHLNLPEQVTWAVGNLRYLYDAIGRKHGQLATYSNSQVLTEYVNDWVYENGDPQFVRHEEGRVVLASSTELLNYSCDNASIMTSTSGSVALTPVTINEEKYVSVVGASGTSLLHAGVATIGGPFPVSEGQRVVLRVKGYSLSQQVNTIVQPGFILWPGGALPIGAANETWTETPLTIPYGVTQITIGLHWNSGSTAGDTFYVNEVQLIQKSTNGTPEYQYDLKDHLGNVRLTFTTKNETDNPLATMETANVTMEQDKFLYYTEAVKLNTPVFDHSNAGGTYYSTRLNGSANERTGLARSISVMPGDTVKAEVYAKYLDTNSGNWTTALNNLIASIVNGTAPVGTFLDGGAPGSTGGVTPPWLSLLDKGSEIGTAPKAYLNYLIFDRDFNFVDGGFVRMTTAAREYGQDGAHEKLAAEFVIAKPGYVYVYLSNDNAALGGSQIEVYFDDLKVTQVKSPVVSMQEYYPFGLTFNSYQRENVVGNNFMYNGKEKQDGLDLGWYDYGARMYQPDIGRWTALDPLADVTRRWSPYNYALDNPIRFIDPDGMSTDDFGNVTLAGYAGVEEGGMVRGSHAAKEKKKGEAGPGCKCSSYDDRGNRVTYGDPNDDTPTAQQVFDLAVRALGKQGQSDAERRYVANNIESKKVDFQQMYRYNKLTGAITGKWKTATGWLVNRTVSSDILGDRPFSFSVRDAGTGVAFNMYFDPDYKEDIDVHYVSDNLNPMLATALFVPGPAIVLGTQGSFGAVEGKDVLILTFKTISDRNTFHNAFYKIAYDHMYQKMQAAFEPKSK